MEQPCDQFSVCHVIPSVNSHVGGPSYSVPAIIDALEALDVNTGLFTLDYPAEGGQCLPQQGRIHSYHAGPFARALRGLQLEAGRQFSNAIAQQYNLIHNHGLWMFPNLFARQAALKHGLPLIISPRGMLEDWSVKRSRIRKQLVWCLFERKNIFSASAFHATSTQELTSLRRLGLQAPVAVIPNGTSMPQEQPPDRSLLENMHPELKNRRWLVFISRIHPKKGLDLLLRVWKKVSSSFPDWQLVLAGPDQIGWKSELLAYINREKVGSLTFLDEVRGEEHSCLLGNANLFVLPSHSENFGIVVAEALAHKVPVITTRGTPWSELKEYNAGWWIENTELEWEKVLSRALLLPSDVLEEMGLTGAKLIQERYAWESIAEKMKGFYTWILYGGPTPDFVDLVEI